jgi:hypothetical protein
LPLVAPLPKLPHQFPPLPKLPKANFSSLPELLESDLPELPALPPGSKAKRSLLNSVDHAAPLPREGMKHVREKSATGKGAGNHRRDFPKESVRKIASAHGAGSSPSSLPKLNVKSNFRVEGTIPSTPTRLYKQRELSTAHVKLKLGPLGQHLIVPVENVKNDQPLSASRIEINRLTGEMNVLAEHISKADLPKPDIDAGRRQDEKANKEWAVNWFKVRMDAIPVVNVEFDSQRRLSRVEVLRHGSKTKTKWLDVVWNGDRPGFAVKVDRLKKAYADASLSTRWSDFSTAWKKFNGEPALAAANARTRQSRAAHAWQQAQALLKFYSKDKIKSGTFLRGSLQNFDYDIGQKKTLGLEEKKNKFKDAYRTGKITEYLEKVSFSKSDNDTVDGIIAGLLVESLKDFSLLLKGSVSVEQVASLVALFPENPEKKGADAAEISTAGKKAIRDKLEEIFGENYKFASAAFKMISAFQCIVPLELENDILQAQSKNNWAAVMSLFGLGKEDYGLYSFSSLNEVERQEDGRRRLMMVFHLLNNAAEYFDVN